jgi:hypothetical protein
VLRRRGWSGFEVVCESIHEGLAWTRNPHRAD